MEELISMTDFVIQREEHYQLKVNKECFSSEISEVRFSDEIINYANFLKRKLELWMFIPCDEDGKPIEGPLECYCNSDIGSKYQIDCGMDCEHDTITVRRYQKAKERVLFEGKWNYSNILNEIKKYDDYCKLDSFDFDNKTIEDLIPYKLKLTKQALKELEI